MATLVGLVTIAVLLGSLTSSSTAKIVFGDIKLYGSKVINFIFLSLEDLPSVVERVLAIEVVVDRAWRTVPR